MDSKGFKISGYTRIKNGRIFSDGNPQFTARELDLENFLKKAYHQMEVNYPKYHKMDGICKLGILAVHALLKNRSIASDTALVFSNSNSSLEIDKKHQHSMASLVSPSIFVYTLPNIVSGEISIKYNLQSENAFFIEERFNAGLLRDYAEVLLHSDKATAVVSGWIDLKNDEYDVFLFLISQEGEIPLSSEKLEQLYLYENE